MIDEPHFDSIKYNTFGKPQRKLILQDLQQGLIQLGMRASSQSSFCGNDLLSFIDEVKQTDYNQLLHKVLTKHV